MVLGGQFQMDVDMVYLPQDCLLALVYLVVSLCCIGCNYNSYSGGQVAAEDLVPGDPVLVAT